MNFNRFKLINAQGFKQNGPIYAANGVNNAISKQSVTL